MADAKFIKLTGKNKYDLTNSSYVHRASTLWNSLPTVLRTIETLDEFKIELKIWIKKEIPI